MLSNEKKKKKKKQKHGNLLGWKYKDKTAVKSDTETWWDETKVIGERMVT